MGRKSSFTDEQYAQMLRLLPVCGIEKTANVIGKTPAQVKSRLKFERAKGAKIVVKKATGLWQKDRDGNETYQGKPTRHDKYMMGEAYHANSARD